MARSTRRFAAAHAVEPRLAVHAQPQTAPDPVHVAAHVKELAVRAALTDAQAAARPDVADAVGDLADHAQVAAAQVLESKRGVAHAVAVQDPLPLLLGAGRSVDQRNGGIDHDTHAVPLQAID